MAARLRKLEARAAAGQIWKDGGGLDLVGFELVGLAVHAEAVFEVETGASWRGCTV